MDNTDKIIKQVLKKDIEIPNSCDIKIKDTFKNKKIKLKIIFSQVATACACIIATTGIVFAGYTAYEKVWVEPKKYESYEEWENNLPSEEISEEERQRNNIVTEDIIREKALDTLEKFGYQDETINSIEIKRGYAGEKEEESYYLVKTKSGFEKGIILNFDSTTGDFRYFCDLDLKYKHLIPDQISDDKMKEIAYDVYNKLGFKDGEYELADYGENTENYFENQKDIIYEYHFYKKNHDIYNKFESVSGSYIVVDGKILYNTINIGATTKYQDNEIKISKEDAIKIALDKEKTYSSKETIVKNAELAIKMMNPVMYQLETGLIDENTYLEVDKLIRNVWEIKIIHSNQDKETWNSSEEQVKYVREKRNKIYYIDCTTGEIIGGEILME